MKLGHLVFRGGFRALDLPLAFGLGFLGSVACINLHLLVEGIVHDQTMGHPYAMWLHRVARDVGIVANVGVVEVGNLLAAIAGPIQVDGVKRWESRHLVL